MDPDILLNHRMTRVTHPSHLAEYLPYCEQNPIRVCCSWSASDYLRGDCNVFYLVFISSFSFCHPFSCHDWSDSMKYSFAYVTDHGPRYLLSNKSIQGIMAKFRCQI